jgi:hypothetical protein
VEGVRRNPGGRNRATGLRDRTTVYIYLPDPGISPTGVIFSGGPMRYPYKKLKTSDHFPDFWHKAKSQRVNKKIRAKRERNILKKSFDIPPTF